MALRRTTLVGLSVIALCACKGTGNMDAGVQDASVDVADGSGETDAGSDASRDAGTPPPDFRYLDYELFSPQGTTGILGSLSANDDSGLSYDFGQLLPGQGYAISLALHGENAQCSKDNQGLGRERAFVFDVTAGETTVVRAPLLCGGAYGTVEVSITVHSAALSCNSLRLSAPSAVVGEAVAVAWADDTQGTEYTLSVAPMAVVGVLQLQDDGADFLCRAQGVATISVRTDKGPCTGTFQSVEVQCTPRDGEVCCPIDALPQQRDTDACMQLGGSPPCFTGCGCLRHGGSASTQIDANGCLEWIMKPRADRAVLLLCSDADGNPNPDPRKPCGSYAPLPTNAAAGSCSDSAVRDALDPTDTICTSSADRSCDPTGKWHIELVLDPPSSKPHNCTGKPQPPGIALDLVVPGDLHLSENGCELSTVHIEPWNNGGECGVFGYSLFFQIDGDVGSGSLHTLESGFCGSETRSRAVAVRARP